MIIEHLDSCVNPGDIMCYQITQHSLETHYSASVKSLSIMLVSKRLLDLDPMSVFHSKLTINSPGIRNTHGSILISLRKIQHMGCTST